MPLTVGMWVPQDNTNSVTRCRKKTQDKRGCQTRFFKNINTS